MNALLDYGTSSSSEPDEDVEACEEKTTESSKPKLPKPTLGESSELQTSVFTNPFVQAELAKAAILEKHVKMVPGKNDLLTINGKKICWNYRKGRCRFGHNCKYAHDSDLQKTPEELEADKQKAYDRSTTVMCESSSTQASAAPPMMGGALDPKSPTDDDVWEQGPDRKKARRPGLSKGLVPGKKVLQFYNDQKKRDANKGKFN